MESASFTVGDVTTDPTNERTPTEHERIENTVAIALKAEEVGLDVFATASAQPRRSPRRPARRCCSRTSPP